MMLDYFDMLSGQPIHIKGIGHVKSPLLSEIAPNTGIGYMTYSLYLNILSWDKEKIIEYDMMIGACKRDLFTNREELSAFDVMTVVPHTRALCKEALQFFLTEAIEWNEEKRAYVTSSKEGDNSEETIDVGEINRDNFETVRKEILQLNFIGLDEDSAPVKHSSEESKELWEKVQSYLAQQAKAQKKEHPEYKIGNIISKLCVAHPSYNLLNIFQLTVFQLYDAFYQYGYLRSANLSESIFSAHGGDKFKFEDWLKPIITNV